MKLKDITEELPTKCMVDMLSESQLKEVGKNFITSTSIMRLLRDNKVPFMVIGAHAMGSMTEEPRATQDVDIVVRQQDYDEVMNLIIKFAKTLGLRVMATGNRIKDKNGNVLVDILTDRHRIYKVALQDAMARGGVYPSPEMFLVMKFLSSHSQLRNPNKKEQDKVDFAKVLANNEINSERVIELLKKTDPEFVLNKDALIKMLGEK